MSESNDIDRVRERKRERLLETAERNDGDGETPAEPISVRGADHVAVVVEQYDAVLLEFYADWCGPCQMLEPVLEELAESTEAAVAKVDVDEHQQLATTYQIRGVPTMVLFDDGEAVEQLTGARDANALEGLIEQHTR